jgi:DNA-binding MarR family transcriptional regulator
MPGSPRPWKPSAGQLAALRALAQLEGRIEATAARVGAYTGQSVDGAAYTLRSLVNRGAAEIGAWDGDRRCYQLTAAGRAEIAKDDARRAADKERLTAWLAAQYPPVTEGEPRAR